MKNHSHIFLFLLLLAILSPPEISAQEKSLLVESIRYQGNTKTSERVIRQYMSIREGQPVTREQLETDRIRLQNTNFFKEVEILITPGREKGWAKVLVKLRERRWPYFQFKSGFNELDGWYISPLGLRFDNLFGVGNYLGYELVFGDRYGSSRLEFTRPYLFNSEYDLMVRLFGDQRNFLHYIDGETFEQKVKYNGAMIGLRGNSGLAKYFALAVSNQKVTADSLLHDFPGDSLEIPAPAYLAPFNGEQNVAKVTFSINIDTRNRPGDPTRGWWGALTLEQGFLKFEQDDPAEKFERIILDLRRYQPLWRGVSAALRVKLGRTSDDAPFYERFYLGGPNSLRGYEDRSQTPAGYGSHYSLGSAELRFPLSARVQERSRLMGVLFYDAGYAWNTPETWQPEKLKTSLGFGARVRVPLIGLLRLDFAYPVPDYKLNFHLSLGHTF